jgi:hypothetical protein
MAKKITLQEIGDMLAHVVKHMATKEDLAELRKEMATKEQLGALHIQVNSIEAQLKLGRYEQRLGNLEDKVFGAARR